MRFLTFLSLVSFMDFTLSFTSIANIELRQIATKYPLHKPLARLASTVDNVLEMNVGKGKTAIIAGASGYIGKAVVREAVRQGYNTVALVRDANKVVDFQHFFEGAEIVECDVQDAEALTKVRSFKKNS